MVDEINDTAAQTTGDVWAHEGETRTISGYRTCYAPPRLVEADERRVILDVDILHAKRE